MSSSSYLFSSTIYTPIVNRIGGGCDVNISIEEEDLPRYCVGCNFSVLLRKYFLPLVKTGLAWPGDLSCRAAGRQAGRCSLTISGLPSLLPGGHCRLSCSTSSNFGGKLSLLCWPKEKYKSFNIFVFDNIMALFTIIM